jgi:hypothetical protein
MQSQQFVATFHTHVRQQIENGCGRAWTPIFVQIFRSVEGVRRLEMVGFYEGKIKAGDVRCHLAPVVCGFPRGWRYSPRGAKKWGEVPTDAKAAPEAGFLHIAGMVPPILAEFPSLHANRGTMGARHSAVQTARNPPQTLPHGTASFISRSDYFSYAIRPCRPPSPQVACAISQK